MKRILGLVTMAAAMVAGLLTSVPAFSQDYPTKPVKLLVGFAAGGPTDVIARVIAQDMSASMGQSVIVENRPGANAIIATEAVAHAPADGYTLLFSSLSLLVNPLLPGTKAPTVTIQPPELTSDSQAYIHGTVDGPREREGTLTVGQGAPLPITIDDHGNFGLMVDIHDKPAVIKVEAKSPAKKVGSATVAVAAPGAKK